MNNSLQSQMDYLDVVADRVRSVEKMPLPDNVGAILDLAAAEAGDCQVWNFFETGETETYEGLRKRVNGLAASLVKIGVTKGSHVAVMLPNIPAMPLTWLALSRIGAVMVPVNTAYKERELGYILNDSDAEFVIIHADYSPVLDGAVALHDVKLPADHVIMVGDESAPLSWEVLASNRLDNFTPAEPVIQADLLNIQYTSGTTGFPKGCMLSHKYWIVSGYSNAFRDGMRFERVLASTPFFYMDPQWLLLMTILQRGTLFVARRQSTTRFLSWLRDFRINFCLFPWVLHKQSGRKDDKENSIVRANIYGVPQSLHSQIEARFGIVAREAFGMTELGPTLFMPIEASDMVGSGFCGRPAPFRECRVVNENGETVGPGAIGELVVRGTGILDGYYGNPEATKSSFFGDWFRTGDLFQHDERGFFRIVGRQKDMVRRSGENIAARELETVLNAFPDVSESAIVGVPDDLRGEEVKAFIVLKDGLDHTDTLLASIVAHCERELAPFKVPRYYAFLSSFPRTGSAKIAKHLLRKESEELQKKAFDRFSGQWS